MTQHHMRQAASTITAEQAGALLMISQQRVRQLVRDGYIPRTARDAYPLVGVVQGYLRFLRDDERRSAKSAIQTKSSQYSGARSLWNSSMSGCTIGST